jgi:hypothetical protein
LLVVERSAHVAKGLFLTTARQISSWVLSLREFMQSARFFFINYALRGESELNFPIWLKPTVIKGQFLPG